MQIDLPPQAWERVLSVISNAKINEMVDVFIEMTKQIQAARAAEAATAQKVQDSQSNK